MSKHSHSHGHGHQSKPKPKQQLLPHPTAATATVTVNVGGKKKISEHKVAVTKPAKAMGTGRSPGHVTHTIAKNGVVKAAAAVPVKVPPRRCPLLSDPGLVQTCTYLDARSVTRVSQCCTRWRTTINNNDAQIWRTLYSLHYPSLYDTTMSEMMRKRTDRKRVIAWKLCYRGQYQRPKNVTNTISSTSLNRHNSSSGRPIKDARSRFLGSVALCDWTLKTNARLLSLLPYYGVTPGLLSLADITTHHRPSSPLIHFLIQRCWDEQVLLELFSDEKFRRHFITVSSLLNDGGYSPLWCAAMRKHWRLVRVILTFPCVRFDELKISVPYHTARSMFHLAAMHSVDACQLFVRPITCTEKEVMCPLPIDILDDNGMTPFLVACSVARVDIMEYLASCGANIHKITTVHPPLHGRSYFGSTALSCVLQSWHSGASAAEFGDYGGQLAWKWCVAHGCTVNRDADDHDTKVASAGSSCAIFAAIFSIRSPIYQVDHTSSAYWTDIYTHRSAIQSRVYHDVEHTIGCDWKRALMTPHPSSSAARSVMDHMDWLLARHTSHYYTGQCRRVLWLLQHGAMIPDGDQHRIDGHSNDIHWNHTTYNHAITYLTSWPAWQAAINNGLNVKTWWRPKDLARPEEGPCGGPLHFAVRYSTPEAIERLIGLGCDVNQMDALGRSPLACLLALPLLFDNSIDHLRAVCALFVLLRHRASINHVATMATTVGPKMYSAVTWCDHIVTMDKYCRPKDWQWREYIVAWRDHQPLPPLPWLPIDPLLINHPIVMELIAESASAAAAGSPPSIILSSSSSASLMSSSSSPLSSGSK